MKIDWNSKYTTISVYSILTFTICLLIFSFAQNIPVIAKGVDTLFTVLSPIIWGLVIGYLLNPIMMGAEKKIRKLTGKTKPHPKLDRVLSVIVSILVFLAAVAALGAIILPEVIKSITNIFDNMGTYFNNLEKGVNNLLKDYPQIVEYINSQFEEIETAVTGYIKDLMPKLGDIMTKLTDKALDLLIALKDFLIGIIVAVYFLLDKEHFQAQLKKLSCALLPQKATGGFLRVCNLTNSSISGFITGKIIDSIIIGILCFICMTLMKLEYALLISVIIGVTNVIPFFGPFFGAIPSALLLLVSSPKQVLPFVVLIFFIQQLDGNVIGPKILGDSTGLSAFWVMFSILVSGGMFGFAGMVLGVPVFAVIYSLTQEFVNFLLSRKNMSTVTMDYAPDAKPEKEDTGEMKSFKLYQNKDKSKSENTDAVKKNSGRNNNTKKK
ncbi:MAG: AI-2E family transporter [Oscillospiraceae bacterium]|nr:AI-2E family transporter [Oscillospiraceae bacterium]